MKIKLLILLFFIFSDTFAQKQKIWFDTDMGNEMDDIYALTRLLVESDKYDILGVSSAHFINIDLMLYDKWNQYPTKGINTVKISQEKNEKILGAFGMMKIPHPMGVEGIMGRSWGPPSLRYDQAIN